MSCVRPLTFLAFGLTVAFTTGGQVRHIEMTPEQEFLVCAQQVLGETVLWRSIFDTRHVGDNPVPQVPCPASRGEFTRLLQKNAGILTLEDGGVAFLVAHGGPISLVPTRPPGARPSSDLYLVNSR